MIKYIYIVRSDDLAASRLILNGSCQWVNYVRYHRLQHPVTIPTVLFSATLTCFV